MYDDEAEYSALRVARCEWCRGLGRKRKPCPLCGALILKDGTMSMMIAGLFADVPVEPRRKARKCR